MFLVSASIHLVNEYADYETDMLTKRTAYSGGSGVLPSGIIPRNWSIYSALLTAGIGFLVQFIAVYLDYHSWETLYIIVIGTVGGWIYSLPPRLAWGGFGELWNTLLGALLLPFFGFVQISKTTDLWVLLAVLPVTFFAFNNLLAVAWPDRKADQKVGKNTLATRFDPRVLKMLHAICTTLSMVVLVIIELPLLVFKSSLIAYPLMILGWFTYTKKEISTETIYGLHLLITVQIISWMFIGVQYSGTI
jgi:1,4-dihydroxy-2-naphthoate octaprenyltransferase